MKVWKINFDASVIATESVAACVIRNHDAKLIRARGKPVPPSSVLFAELFGAWLRVKVAVMELKV